MSTSGRMAYSNARRLKHTPKLPKEGLRHNMARRSATRCITRRLAGGEFSTADAIVGSDLAVHLRGSAPFASS